MARGHAAAAVVGFALLAVPAGAQSSRSIGLDQLSESLRELARRIGPSVVEIVTTAFAPGYGSDGAALFTRRSGKGSGVLLTADGYMVTNAHVVANARRVQVVLPRSDGDGGSSILGSRGRVAGAQVVGSDRETDLAVLKVQAEGLPFLELSDSDELRQGELVLAFGSPLGLEHSVTMGVVSSVARQLAPESPMIYVQTDAAINPGNSGGALVDSRGRLVGINTLIFSQSGGNEGIGFAAPSNIVRAVFEQIRRTGRVRRGEIGARTQTITAALARALALSREEGVLVSDVYPGSPAAAAGLRIGDIVLTLDGKPMENARQFQVNVYQRQPGAGVRLQVQRGASTLSVTPLVRERPGDPQSIARLVSPERNLIQGLGILALDLDEQVRGLMPPLRASAGVVVAAGTGGEALWGDDPLAPGDVIYSANGSAVTDVDSLRELLAGMRPGEPVALHVERAGELRFVTVEVARVP